MFYPLFSVLTCPSSKGTYSNSEVSFDCTVEGVTSISMFSVNRGTSTIYTSEQMNAARVSAEIDAVSAVLEIDVDSTSVVLTFQNVTCDLEGSYTVQINNASSITSSFQLNVDSK